MNKINRININLSSKTPQLTHILLGGAICFLASYILLSSSQFIIHMIFFSLGLTGLLAFKEIEPALFMFVLALVYLPSGFFSGLYTGYKIKENLKIILIFPPIIGLTALIFLRVFSGVLVLSPEDLGRDIIIPLLAGVISSYLGGYSINWKKED